VLGDTLDLHLAGIKKELRVNLQSSSKTRIFEKNNSQITRDEEVKVFGDTLTSFLLFTALNG
jgi:hypothetical protein